MSKRKKDESPKDRTVIIAGVFAVVASIISGIFLLINTSLEHKLSFPTPTTTSTVSGTTQPFTTPSSTPMYATQPPNTIAPTPKTSGNYIDDTLAPLGGRIVGWLAVAIIWFVIILIASFIPWNWLWLNILRPLLFFALTTWLFFAIGAFLGSLFGSTIIGTIIGGIVGLVVGCFVGLFFWAGGKDI